MGRKGKNPLKPSENPLPESITITIAPKIEGAKTDASEHNVSVGTSNKQTSLFLKKGECVNFDVRASESSNSGYELVTNDFENCLVCDKPATKPEKAEDVCQSNNVLGAMKPFINREVSGGKSDSPSPISKVSVRMASNGEEDKSAASSISNMGRTSKNNLGAKIAKFIGIEGVMEKTEENKAHAKEAGHPSIKDPKIWNGEKEKDGVVVETLIRPGTVSEEYVRRLSSICMQLCGTTSNLGKLANSDTSCRTRRCLGTRVKELINTVFSPKEDNSPAPTKINIPERSISFESLIKIYESR